MVPSSNIQAKLGQWKNQLIDTTKRNKLLFFRPLKTGSIRLTEPDPESLFDWLVCREKPLTLIWRDKSEPREGVLDPDSEREEADTPATPLAEPRLSAGEVLTDRDDPQLNSILYRLRLRGRTAVAEQGVNILFVAFGILQWIDPAKNEQRTSPLILVPVDLRRESALTPYRLFPIDEEVLLNPTLVFLLERDCHLTLPPLPDDLDSAKFEDYCRGLEAAVSGQQGWSARREVHLGTFSFQKLVIYKDLETNTNRLSSHPLIQALAGDPTALPKSPVLPTARQLDETLSPDRTFQVLDADSSQQEAIEAVKGGVSLVLQGPPGTGKSQTIANIIAEMLAAGKRVLFVSEKMAALQVVHARLKARKLDDFCLEIHSAKVSKLEVLKEFGRVLRLKTQDAPPDTSRFLSQLGDLRRHLNGFVRALHTPHAGTKWTPFHVHGQLAAVQDVPELNFSYAEPGSVDPQKLAQLDSLLIRMERVRPVILGCETHPWRGCMIPEFTFEVQSDIHERFNSLRGQLRALQDVAWTLASACRLPAPISLQDVDRLLRIADLARATPWPPARWFKGVDLEQLTREAEAYESRFRMYRQRHSQLLSRYRESLLTLRLSDLQSLLAQLNEATLLAFRTEETPARQVLWKQASTLKPLLAEAVQLFTKLPRAVGALSAHCGVPVQLTAREAQRLFVLTALIVTDPRPTHKWFSRAGLRVVRERATRASEVYPSLWEQRARLLANYAPSIVELDLDAVIRRFAADYTSLTRILRPNYWKDMRLLRALQRAPRKLTVEMALGDLQLAREVRRLERWVQENEAHLDAELGLWFKGRETSWSELRDALDHLGAVLDWFGQSAPPLALVQLLTTSGSDITTLQRLYREATAAASRTDTALEQLLHFVEPQRLPFGATALTDVEFCRVHEWLTLVRAACVGFWSAQEIILPEAHRPHALTWQQVVEDLREGCWLQEEEAALSGLAGQLCEQYEHFFHGLTTDWEQITKALAWARRFQSAFEEGTVPDDVVELISSDKHGIASVRAATGPCREERLRVQEGVKHLTSLFTPMIFESGGGVEAWSFDHVCSWLEERIRHSADLEHWTDFRRLQERCEQTGLGSFFTMLMLQCPEEGSLRDLFLRRFYRLWLDRVYAESQPLRKFRGQEHECLVEQFRVLDRAQWERLGPARVREVVLARRQPIGWSHSPNSEPGILTRELEKRRKHKPLRQLFAEIPNLVQELKPCLLMSPMTVSQLLDPRRYRFDLVIFDEASQICAEDAVGAIYRGKQVVVAGDRHQLPPTRFFTAGLADAYDGEDELEAAEEEVYESILDQCRTMLPAKPLKWHYRSRHESLIAFSNLHIYSKEPQESLKTFPSGLAKASGLGIELIQVPDAIYDRRKTRRNPIEARKVAELVIQHMRHSPRRSLGVVAFSEAQQMAILTEVERLRAECPELDQLFDENRSEPFFVKNLENVQGDERDVIILDVGYGRDASGELSLNFGPLNRQGGERRLNVAITRAKYHVKLVSSLTAKDIDLSRTQSRGIHLLRAYLEYSERGPAALVRETGTDDRERDPSFEDVVRAAIERHGYTVVPRVGYGGYRLDLAVQDPDDPDRYLLGVECDGSEYAASPTSRDRDRLSTAVLAGHDGEPGLGWNLHRVWSADWIKDPEGETTRLGAVLARAQSQKEREGSDLAATILEAASPPTVEPEDVTDDVTACFEPGEDKNGPVPTGVIPYQRAVLKVRGWPEDFYTASRAVILYVLKQVVTVEGPIRVIDATRRVAAAWRIRNAGCQVQAVVATAVEEGVRRGQFCLRKDFLWPVDMQAPPVRTHEGGEYVRKIEEICPEEIAEGVMLVMQQSFSLPEADLVVQTARTLGYARTGPDVRAGIGAAVEALGRGSRLRRENGSVVLENGH
jgi:hypothetical protein